MTGDVGVAIGSTHDVGARSFPGARRSALGSITVGVSPRDADPPPDTQSPRKRVQWRPAFVGVIVQAQQSNGFGLFGPPFLPRDECVLVALKHGHLLPMNAAEFHHAIHSMPAVILI